MPSRYYVTTPIYYVNAPPHLGTAYTTILADVLRRFRALCGDESRMLTGTDEHGAKLEAKAAEHGMTPIDFVNKMSAPFRAAWPQLNIEPDDFIRTTEPRHIKVVQDLWQKVEKNGGLYLGHYEDWYCIGCESFKTEKELLPGNLCPVHQTAATKLKEETYFFRLSDWEKPLLKFYEKNPNFIAPESRRNEVISFVEGGLKDLSVSRTSLTWGIPVPGNPRHVMYVWFDALTNYISALGPDGANANDLRRFWPPSSRAVHLVGKDILRFHAIYWPAFLLAAGYREDELPSQIFAHGFLTVDGEKMSKSLRNGVDPLRIATELGADVLRYYLLRAISCGQDGDFDHAALIERYNADLGKNLGNLLSRVLGLCTKMTAGKTPEVGTLTELEQSLIDTMSASARKAAAAFDEIAPHRALEAIWDVSFAANQYVDRAAPWAEAKAGRVDRVETILATLLEALRHLSVMMWPVMPKKSDEMRLQLGLSAVSPRIGDDQWPSAFEPRAGGEPLAPSGPLFPTLDKDAVHALLEKLVPQVPEAPAANTSDPVQPAQSAEKAAEITYDDFTKIDLRVGIVKTAEKVPKKDKLLRLTVDLGEAEPRQIIAGLALSFAPDALVGQRVLVVSNLAPRDFGKGLVSHGMLLATGPSDALSLASAPDNAPAGARLK